MSGMLTADVPASAYTGAGFTVAHQAMSRRVFGLDKHDLMYTIHPAGLAPPPSGRSGPTVQRTTPNDCRAARTLTGQPGSCFAFFSRKARAWSYNQF